MLSIDMHDLVALTESLTTQRFPFGDELFLPKGLVGTVVEIYAQGEAYEVEFSGSDGEAFAMETLKPEQLFLLHFELPAAQARESAAEPMAAANSLQNGTSWAEGALAGQSLRQ